MCCRNTRCVFRWRRGIASVSQPSRPALLLSFSVNRHVPAVVQHSLCVVSRPTLVPSLSAVKPLSSRGSNTPWCASAIAMKVLLSFLRNHRRVPNGVLKMSGRGCGNVRRPSSSKLCCAGRSAAATGAAEATVCPYRRRATGGDGHCGEQSGACVGRGSRHDSPARGVVPGGCHCLPRTRRGSLSADDSSHHHLYVFATHRVCGDTPRHLRPRHTGHEHSVWGHRTAHQQIAAARHVGWLPRKCSRLTELRCCRVCRTRQNRHLGSATRRRG